MYIESIKNELLLDKYEIIELKVRGKHQELRDFCFAIQDMFDLAHDEWDISLSMLTMTFDKKPKEQTLTMIKAFTKDYIASQAKDVSHRAEALNTGEVEFETMGEAVAFLTAGKDPGRMKH